MLRVCAFALVSAALLALASANEDPQALFGVAELTPENFTQSVNASPHLVFFFAPWCGHCKNAKHVVLELNKSEIFKKFDVTMAKVDCTKDQELCASNDVQGYPTFMLYLEGEDSGMKYHGERSLDAVEGYIREHLDEDYVAPEKQPDLADEFELEVAHVDEITFSSWRQDHPEAFVMFYAPWCGHCKQMKPQFAQLYEVMKDQFGIAAVDCTSPAGKPLCDHQGVHGFPTLNYYETSDSEAELYQSARSFKAFKKFLMRKSEPDWVEPFENTPLWDDNGKVVHLTDDHWDPYRSSNPHMLVMFYAPWCGHCKSMKPEFAEASKKFGKSFKFVAVDCTDNPELCKRYDVQGYPTVMYFESSEDDGSTYSDSRTAIAMSNWVDRKMTKLAQKQANEEGDVDVTKLKLRVIKQMLKDRGVECVGCTEKGEYVSLLQESLSLPKVEKKQYKMTWAEEQRLKKAQAHAEEGWADGDGNVIHLTSETFPTYLDANSKTIVMFHAEWCGHCKSLKPEYVAASLEVEYDDVKFAAVECDMNPTLCRGVGISSYPTVRLFTSSSGQGQDVSARNTKKLVAYANQLVNPDWKPEVLPFVNEPLWGDDNGNVVHLTDDHFDSYRQDHPKMLAMFHAPWCGHCKALKPHYAAASVTAAASDVVVVAVDCTEHTETCSSFSVSGYPTLRYFSSSSDEGEDPNIGRTEEAIVEFLISMSSSQAVEENDPDLKSEL